MNNYNNKDQLEYMERLSNMLKAPYNFGVVTKDKPNKTNDLSDKKRESHLK